jgi:hypothetical protein
MMTTQKPHLVAVSTPGGVAPQLRVQYCAASDGDWQWYATFSDLQQAELCLGQLQQEGYQARLVEYRCCPASC